MPIKYSINDTSENSPFPILVETSAFQLFCLIFKIKKKEFNVKFLKAST